MKILVCIKQVPGSSNVEVDPVTGVLKRSGIPSKCNPYDLYAIEAALSAAERFGGSVESLTMGPPQAGAVIQESICMGAALPARRQGKRRRSWPTCWAAWWHAPVRW